MPELSYISPKAVVRESPIQGRGLFALEAIKRGEIVCIKGGHIFDRQTLRQAQDLPRTRRDTDSRRNYS